MNHKNIPEDQLDKILTSLDDLEKADPSPFFQTRLKGKMTQTGRIAAFSFSTWLKPALIFPLLAALLVLNVITIVHKKQRDNIVATDAGSKNTSLVQQVAKDYDLSIITY